MWLFSLPSYNPFYRIEKWGEEGKYPGAIYMVVTSSRGRFRCAKTAYGLRIRRFRRSTPVAGAICDRQWQCGRNEGEVRLVNRAVRVRGAGIPRWERLAR